MEEKGKKTEEIIRKEAGKTSSTAGGLTPEEKANMQRMMKHLPQAPNRPDPEEDPAPRRVILKENRHGMAPDGGDEDDRRDRGDEDEDDRRDRGDEDEDDRRDRGDGGEEDCRDRGQRRRKGCRRRKERQVPPSPRPMD